MIMCAEL